MTNQIREEAEREARDLCAERRHWDPGFKANDECEYCRDITAALLARSARAAVNAWEEGRKAGRREGMDMMDPHRPHPSPQNPYLANHYEVRDGE